MKIISDGEYEDLMRLRDKLELARSDAMAQTEKIILLSASLRQADARAKTLEAAMKTAAATLANAHMKPEPLIDACLRVAADLRKAAS